MFLFWLPLPIKEINGFSTQMKFSDIPNPKAADALMEEFRKKFSSKVCLAPTKDCGGHIVSAHTLSAEGMLRPISRDGKVYSLKADLYGSGDELPTKLALRGIKETSVFNGFCAKHDKQLFAPIEDEAFICKYEQIFLFTFRAVAKESYLKRKQAEGVGSLEQIKKIHNIPADVDVAFSTQFQLHQMASIRGAEEIERIKARLDQIYIAKDFARIRTAIIQFKSNPSVTCNFVYVPDYDFEGNSLQSFTDFNNDLSHLCVTILPTNTGGFAIFSHLDTANSAPRKLIESLFLQKDITSSLVWLIACQTENFALSPVWYEGLLQNQKDAFMSAFHSNTDIFEPVINQLKNRKLTVASWNPENRFFCKCQLIFWLA